MRKNSVLLDIIQKFVLRWQRILIKSNINPRGNKRCKPSNEHGKPRGDVIIPSVDFRLYFFKALIFIYVVFTSFLY